MVARLPARRSAPRKIMMDWGELGAALADGRLEMRYQPIVRFDTGEPIGFEALARINHPVAGIVLPAAFVPQIEDAGLAAEMTELVAAAAFADMAGAAIAPLRLSIGVNLPLDVLLVPAVLDRLDAQRRAAGLDPGQIVIELTESQPVTDLVGLRNATERVRAAGYRAVIDDLAPAQPLIAGLMELPFTGLKLDKGLVQTLKDSREVRRFITRTVAAAAARGLTVCVEGVENRATWQRFRKMGADFAQGFLIA